MDPSYAMLIVMVVVIGGMMWWQSKKAKQQQAEKQDFRRNLKPGTEIITIGQVIGKVVEVDEQYEEIVIDSEGSKMRFSFNAIAREYTRPAYVSDDEVDENGNPLPDNANETPTDDAEAQKPIEGVTAEVETKSGDNGEAK
ncbi:preprotein translocase subunit YajC [Bifidobacterium sp. UTCIF-3]|nr:preprotein translocase subunit YajC [Bifidobacterium sp. UTCIF-1]TPF80557.1 preprotein translocase subunit YajC [Bifidobacterium sp. UTCIF-24]TPF82344.1 preprotein translocase subunit YajC [Bifidobacterium sp. UTCIF-3]TPF84623.1 preprotein translocase subunit YajC [Bifidobacterium sp. UTCIF-36]TPF89614.1 preprotein translocase subunit YajC [Bifidobacterium sp. UTBIF-56]TPF93863.1 preprotein translocase subunit YajC [Bifidobacterium sp. UTBIF-68]